MRNKSQIATLEAIVSIVILFVTLSILFPKFTYQNKWDAAKILLKERDILTTADRIGKLYELTFNSSALIEFLQRVIPEKNIIYWSQAEGGITPNITIACNCTQEEAGELQGWLKGLKINNRSINFTIAFTNLDSINPIIRKTFDVLLIFGYKNLTPYVNTLKTECIDQGKGIIEIADMNETQVQGDLGQQEIFGIGVATSQDAKQSEYDVFRKSPQSVTNITYLPFKYFYHVPIPLFTSPLPPGNVPTDPNLASEYCKELSTGSLKIQWYIIDENTPTQPYAYKFWICNSTKVFFDSDWNESADMIVNKGETFNLPNLHNTSENFTFSLNYIDGQEKIGVSFKPNYKFYDFIKYNLSYKINKPGNGPPEHAVAAGLKNKFAEYHVLTPGDGNLNRILIQGDNTTQAGEPIPGVILNASSLSRVAWISNFTDDGVGDDERLLLTSLILWAAGKKTTSILAQPFKEGYFTSYVNVVNQDMYEVYKFTLGVGYPR